MNIFMQHHLLYLLLLSVKQTLRQINNRPENAIQTWCL